MPYRDKIRGLSLRVSGLLESRVYSNRQLMEFLFLSLIIYLMLDAVIVAWFIVTPLAVQSDIRPIFGLAMLAYNVGYLVSNCHQMPQRSLIISGFEMPFCSRDTGVYVGCLIGGLLPFLKVRQPRWLKSFWLFIAALLPLVIDGVSQTIFNLRESSNELRLLTGIIFGFGFAYYFAARIVERSRGIVKMGREFKTAVSLNVVVLLMLLFSAYIVGGYYKTLVEAVAESGLHPTFVTYVSHRALTTIPYDPYIDSYDDAVLAELLTYEPKDTGVWVIYQGTMEQQGKYVWFNGGNGTFKIIKDKK